MTVTTAPIAEYDGGDYLAAVRAVDALASGTVGLLDDELTLSVARVWVDRLGTRPYAADDYAHGVFPYPRDLARKFGHIEPQPPWSVNMLTFDIDHPDAVHRLFAPGVPAPSLICVNRDNGHAHAGYFLRKTVPTHDASGSGRRGVKLAQRTQEGLQITIGADPHYTGKLFKNPERGDRWDVHPRDLSTPAHLYELRELRTADMPTIYRRPSTLSNPLSRNCTLFDDVRTWAYRAVRRYWGGSFDKWRAAVEEYGHKRAARLSTEYPTLKIRNLLPFREIVAVCWSVAVWVWQNVTADKFAARQAALGARGGRANTVAQNAARVLGPATRSARARDRWQSVALLG